MTFINDKLKSMNYQENSSVEEVSISEQNSTTRQISETSRFSFDLEKIMDEVDKSVLGQKEAVKSIENMLKMVLADIGELYKPLYTILLLGPTGVGKTEMVKTLAYAIHNDRDHFCRIDMNTLAQEHYSAAFTGAPPGYVGSKENFSLFDKDKIEGSFSKPGIVLFDEVEKADQSVINALLNVFDYGKLVLATGQEEINFRNSIIFMTSNIGSSKIFEHAVTNIKTYILNIFHSIIHFNKLNKSEHELLKNIINKQLEKIFLPEFINRIDDVVIYSWLDKKTIYGILDLNINQFNTRIKKYNCSIIIEDEAKDFIIKKGFDKKYGARALKRSFRKLVEIPMASFLIKKQEETKDKIKVRVKKGELVFDVYERKST